MTSKIRYYAKDTKELADLISKELETTYYIAFKDQLVYATTKQSNSLESLDQIAKVANTIYVKPLSDNISLINYKNAKEGFRRLTAQEEKILLDTLTNKKYRIKYYAKNLTTPEESTEMHFTVQYFIEFKNKPLSVKTKDTYPIKILGEVARPAYLDLLSSSIFSKSPVLNYENSAKGFRKLTIEEEAILLKALNNEK